MFRVCEVKSGKESVLSEVEVDKEFGEQLYLPLLRSSLLLQVVVRGEEPGEKRILFKEEEHEEKE